MAYALSAYLMWGVLPLYFRTVSSVHPFEIVAQRVLWSVIFIAGVLLAAGRMGRLRRAVGDKRVVLTLAATAGLIGLNWLIYVWAVLNGHVLATSLGYYLNPLVNVAMGVVVLKERLSRAQVVAVMLAAAGVLVLALGAPDGLWISLTLAVSFASYGLLRKIVAVEALEGLAVETLILAVPAAAAIAWFASAGALSFGTAPDVSLLLMAGGVVTALPLLLFAAGARRLRYSTVGILQFVAPTIQFGLAVLVFREPLSLAQLACFSAIWAGLAIYLTDSIRTARRAPA
ncbi:EamA family transporter RarD [Sphingomonas jejuensis]